MIVAGVQFDRARAGAEPAAFMLALVQCTVFKATFPGRKARAAGEAFEAGPREEWRDCQSGAASGAGSA